MYFDCHVLILHVISYTSFHIPYYLIYMYDTLREKQFVATGLFLEAAGIRAAPTVACSGSSTAAAPTNGTVGAAGNTSRPYKYVDL